MIKSDDIGLCAKNNEFLCKEDWAKTCRGLVKAAGIVSITVGKHIIFARFVVLRSSLSLNPFP
jgi:hypothetical protein